MVNQIYKTNTVDRIRKISVEKGKGKLKLNGITLLNAFKIEIKINPIKVQTH
jgi:hypothetical protein